MTHSTHSQEDDFFVRIIDATTEKYKSTAEGIRDHRKLYDYLTHKQAKWLRDNSRFKKVSMP